MTDVDRLLQGSTVELVDAEGFAISTRIPLTGDEPMRVTHDGVAAGYRVTFGASVDNEPVIVEIPAIAVWIGLEVPRPTVTLS